MRNVGEPVELAEPGSVIMLRDGVLPVTLPQSVFMASGRPMRIAPPRQGTIDLLSLHTLVGTADELARAPSAKLASPAKSPSAGATGRTTPVPAGADSSTPLDRWPTVQPSDTTETLVDAPACSLPPVHAGQPALGAEARLRLQENALRHWEHYMAVWAEVGSHLSAAVGIAPDRLEMNQSGVEHRAAVEEDALIEEARRRLSCGGPNAWQSGLRSSREHFVSVGSGGLFLPVRQRPLDGAAHIARIRRPNALAPLAGGRSLSGSVPAPALKARPQAAGPDSLSGSANRWCAETDWPAWLGAESLSTRAPRSPPRAQSPVLEGMKGQLAIEAPDVIRAMSLRSPTYYGRSTLKQQHGAPTPRHQVFDGADNSGLFVANSPILARRGGGDQACGSSLNATAEAAVNGWLSGTHATSPGENHLERSPSPGQGSAPSEPGNGSNVDHFSCSRRALDFDVSRGCGGEEIAMLPMDVRGIWCTVSASSLAFQAREGEADVREVRVHNGGSTALAFEWVHAPRHAPLATPTAVAGRRCFGLRDGKGTLAPGATAACAVSFASDSPGIFHDRWRLVLNPCPEDDQCAQHILDLRGVCASAADANAASRRLEATVAARVVEAAVREIVMQNIVDAAANEAATGSRAPPAAEHGGAETGGVRAPMLAPNDEPRAARLGAWTAWAAEAAPGMRSGQALRVFAALDALSLGQPGGTWTGDPSSLEVQLMDLPAGQRSQPMARLHQLLEQASTSADGKARAARLEEVAAAEAAALASAVSIGLLGASAHLSIPARVRAEGTPIKAGSAGQEAGGETPGGQGVRDGRVVRGGVAMAWCWESASWVAAAELAEAAAAARTRQLAAARDAAELQASLAKKSKGQRKKAEAARASTEAKAAEAAAATAVEETAAAQLVLNVRDAGWVRAQAYARARDEVVAMAVRESLLRFAAAAAELDA